MSFRAMIRQLPSILMNNHHFQQIQMNIRGNQMSNLLDLNLLMNSFQDLIHGLIHGLTNNYFHHVLKFK
jgi:hypothetical protein